MCADDALWLALGVGSAEQGVEICQTSFGTLQALFGASTTDLQAVEGVGENRARVIRDGLVRLAESAYTERIS